VSLFVNVPGLYTRGSGFTELAYAFITIFALINSITFFATPLPKPVRSLSLALSVFLFVNAVIIVLSPPLRHEQGWVGLATVLWAALVGGIWTILTDRVVEWGKAEEEERLIGRVEDRYTGVEWLKVILATVGLIIVVALEVLITLTLVLRMRDASLPVIGQKYWVQQHRFQVHVACFGNASSDRPLVFVVGGESSAEYFSTWIEEARQEGIIGQYCYWDRPGYQPPLPKHTVHKLMGRYGFSDNAPSPMSVGAAIDILSVALPKANITENSPGWVFVSHGVGGLYSRVLAARHPEQVKSLLLVDTVPESLIPKVFTQKRTFILLVRGIISPLGIDRLAGWIFKHRSREDRVWGISSWRSDRVIKSQFQESLVAGSISTNEVIAAQAIIPKSVTYVVVSSGKRCKKDKEWETGQRDLGQGGPTNIWEGIGRTHIWDVVDKAGHDVWMDPEGKKVLKKRLEQLVKAAST